MKSKLIVTLFLIALFYGVWHFMDFRSDERQDVDIVIQLLPNNQIKFVGVRPVLRGHFYLRSMEGGGSVISDSLPDSVRTEFAEPIAFIKGESNKEITMTHSEVIPLNQVYEVMIVPSPRPMLERFCLISRDTIITMGKNESDESFSKKCHQEIK